MAFLDDIGTSHNLRLFLFLLILEWNEKSELHTHKCTNESGSTSIPASVKISYVSVSVNVDKVLKSSEQVTKLFSKCSKRQECRAIFDYHVCFESSVCILILKFH